MPKVLTGPEMGSITSLVGFGGCKLEAYGLNIIVLKVKFISVLTSNPFNSPSFLLIILPVINCTLTFRSSVTEASPFDFRR